MTKQEIIMDKEKLEMEIILDRAKKKKENKIIFSTENNNLVEINRFDFQNIIKSSIFDYVDKYLTDLMDSDFEENDINEKTRYLFRSLGNFMYDSHLIDIDKFYGEFYGVHARKENNNFVISPSELEELLTEKANSFIKNHIYEQYDGYAKEDVDFEDIGRIYYYVFDFLKYLLTIFKELYL